MQLWPWACWETCAPLDPLALELKDSDGFIPLLNVPARLDEFRDMQDGWADGMQHPSDWGSGYGKAPNHEGLDWLADKFTSEYPDDLPLPHTYPTPEGGIRMEWNKDNNAVIFEIDLESRSAYWLWFDEGSDADDERHLNLNDMKTWEWLAAEIRHKLESKE